MTDIKRTQAAVQAWLDTVPFLTDVATLTPAQLEELLELLGHPGMRHLLGLQVSARQGYYVSLANTGLKNQQDVVAAAVIQGIIRGIDLLPQTLLSLVTPDEAPDPQPSQEQPR